jgi:hypothetical protein
MNEAGVIFRNINGIRQYNLITHRKEDIPADENGLLNQIGEFFS